MSRGELPVRYRSVYEAGCDEAGRGSLMGPVFAAAVILPDDFPVYVLDDSKKLSPHQREEARLLIEKYAISWAVAQADQHEIDQINILNASILAMHRALSQLSPQPDLILVDGNRFKKYKNIPYECVVKGDSKLAAIAAASILAKTHRDEFVVKLHDLYPQYGWASNKGYATRTHVEAIRRFGYSPFHRKSFHLNLQLKLF
ncbi:MAG: ribonuclease HII [Bacteroidales bacterium]|jgi:ribonuclease HII